MSDNTAESTVDQATSPSNDDTRPTLTEAEKRRRRREARQQRILNAGNDRLSKITQLMTGAPPSQSSSSEDLNKNNINASESTENDGGTKQAKVNKEINDGESASMKDVEFKAPEPKQKSTPLQETPKQPSVSLPSAPVVQSPSVKRTPLQQPSSFIQESDAQQLRQRTKKTKKSDKSSKSEKSKITESQKPEVLPIQIQAMLYEKAIRRWNLIHLAVMMIFSVGMFVMVWNQTTEIHVDGSETLGRLLSEEAGEIRIPVLVYTGLIDLFLQHHH
ncbi:hypothetical protein BKA69DRAFT_1082727 [Paraphysoderma sedebokerense]|nr:hypothetical protein BKA69DRAFT_1082672 [Paraphysoderma sedebokerense]KAI9139964.1 hypothetical protein BKA69DRAFT_1082727 [Paraphysoderma sedebokerense]